MISEIHSRRWQEYAKLCRPPTPSGQIRTGVPNHPFSRRLTLPARQSRQQGTRAVHWDPIHNSRLSILTESDRLCRVFESRISYVSPWWRSHLHEMDVASRDWVIQDRLTRHLMTLRESSARILASPERNCIVCTNNCNMVNGLLAS